MGTFIQEAFLFFSQTMGLYRAKTFLSFSLLVKVLCADPDDMPTL